MRQIRIALISLLAAGTATAQTTTLDRPRPPVGHRPPTAAI